MMRGVSILFAIGGLALSGCQPSSAPPKSSVRVTSDGQGDSVSPLVTPGGQSKLLSDQEPCASRLQDIAGSMLLYSFRYKRLPDKLEELRATADFDQEMNFTCPETGRPYVYVPDGLSIPGRDERLVLHDDAPVHHGARCGIVAVERKGDRPPTMSAVTLPEEVFRLYQPSPKRIMPTSRPTRE